MSIIEGIGCLPPILSTESPKRATTRESLAQVAVVDLGDSRSSLPYMIVGFPPLSPALLLFSLSSRNMTGIAETKYADVEKSLAANR